MSVSANTLTTVLPAGTRIDVKKNGATIHQIAVDGSQVITAGTPITPVPQPVVVAAFIAPNDARWQGLAINVTSDGAWWRLVADGEWLRIAPPIAAKGGE
jgi:hypothetical protein